MVDDPELAWLAVRQAARKRDREAVFAALKVIYPASPAWHLDRLVDRSIAIHGKYTAPVSPKPQRRKYCRSSAFEV